MSIKHQAYFTEKNAADHSEKNSSYRQKIITLFNTISVVVNNKIKGKIPLATILFAQRRKTDQMVFSAVLQLYHGDSSHYSRHQY